LTVYAVLYQTAFNHFSNIFGKSNLIGWANNNSSDFAWMLNMHRADFSGHKIWGPALNTSTGGNSYMTTNNTAIWTHDGFTGGPSLIGITYSSFADSPNFIFKINGNVVRSSGLTGSIKEAPDLDFVIGSQSNGQNRWRGKISEFIIFDQSVDDWNDTLLENYLKGKWKIGS